MAAQSCGAGAVSTATGQPDPMLSSLDEVRPPSLQTPRLVLQPQAPEQSAPQVMAAQSCVAGAVEGQVTPQQVAWQLSTTRAMMVAS